MKINSLTISGFGPFRSTQTVDFSAFEGDVFLIDGNTGAGKSSILDSITYALYNDVARYDSKISDKVRSDYCSPAEKTEVVLDFDLKDGRYRVTRNPEYQGLRKNSVLPAVQQRNALLEKFESGQWSGVAAGQRDVGVDLAKILPLTKGQFLQVILLAQNKFAEFLHAQSGDRQVLLRALFHTDRFDSIEQAFKARKTELEAALGAVTATAQSRSTTVRAIVLEADVVLDPLDCEVGAVLGTSRLEHYLAILETAAGSSAAALSLAQHSESEAQSAHTTVVTAKARQVALLTALAKRDELKLRHDTMASEEIRLGTAERAEKVRSVLTNRDSAIAERDALEDDRLAAHEDWAEHDSAATVSPTSKALQSQVKSLEKTLTELALAEDLEGTVSEGEGAIEALTAQLKELAQESASLMQQSTTLPANIAATEKTLQEIGRQEVQLVAAQTAQEVAAKRFTAATLVLALTEQHENALADQAAKTGKAGDATQNLAALLSQQLTGYAATIANKLHDGEACAVCGSTTHPALATADDHDLVTPEDIDTAREAESLSRALQDRAVTTVSTVASALAQQTAFADGLNVRQAQEAQETADDLVDVLVGAIAVKPALDVALNDMKNLSATLTEATDTNRVQQASGTAQLTSIRGLLSTNTVKRDAARSVFATIGDRIASVETHHASADSYLHTLLAAETSVTAVTTAQASVAAALTAGAFANEEDCIKTLLSDDALTALREATNDYKGDVKAQREFIRQETAEGVTETPIDATAFEAALEEAKEVLKVNQTLNLLASQRAESLESLTMGSRAGDVANAALLSEFSTVNTLSRLTAGDDPNTFKMRLESFVLAAKLEEIVEAANKRLSSMTQERYELEYDDELAGNAKAGLGIKVLDNHTGQGRSAKSLSGGETFLASLALALGLAEVVSSQAGGIRLDTLFIDEGFGALDSGTLGIAMRTIQDLRAGGRTIGLISHVEEMKEQIPHKLHVVKTKDGSSQIKIEA
jgi:exonuclease SbcC